MYITFPHIDLIKHSVTKFSIPWHLSLQFLKEYSPNGGILMRIIYHGIIRSSQKWSEMCIMHWLMDTIQRTKTQTLPLRKIRACYFVRAVYHGKTHVIPNPVIAATWTSSLIFHNAEKQQQHASHFLQIQPKTIRNSYKLQIWFQVEFYFRWRPSLTPSSLFWPSESNLWVLRFDRWCY